MPGEHIVLDMGCCPAEFKLTDPDDYTTLCCAVPCHAGLCHAALCQGVLFHAVLRYAMLGCAVLGCAMLCCAKVCCAVACCAVLRQEGCAVLFKFKYWSCWAHHSVLELQI